MSKMRDKEQSRRHSTSPSKEKTLSKTFHATSIARNPEAGATQEGENNGVWEWEAVSPEKNFIDKTNV